MDGFISTSVKEEYKRGGVRTTGEKMCNFVSHRQAKNASV